jgi:hypothetical protein
MLGVTYASLLLLPCLILAYSSAKGNKAGCFVLFAWLAGALIFGLLGLCLFLYGVAVVGLIAYIFRDRLDMQRWWSRKGKESPPAG